MITMEMLKQAYEEGIVELIDSPNGDGTVCGIGGYWFYFDMEDAENYRAVDYVKKYKTAFILYLIKDALESMVDDNNDYDAEYEFYESYIREQLSLIDKHRYQMRIAANKISELLEWTHKAKCEYLVMNDDYLSLLAFPQLACDNRGNNLIKGDEYMIITCSNGYKYYINISIDSVLTACAEVFDFIQYKL